jgi:hypothetical protein
MSIDEQKESFRAALQELKYPASTMSAYKAMQKLHKAYDDLKDQDGSIAGDFVGDEEFLKEIFSARVVQVVMDASQEEEEFHPSFYRYACGILSLLFCENTELADAFVAHDGALFLLEYLESFSLNRPILISCFTLYEVILSNLNATESTAFAGLIMEKLADVFELNYETMDKLFYHFYCSAVGSSFHYAGDAGAVVATKLLERIVLHVWRGIHAYKHDEGAHDAGLGLLCYLVGEEIAKEMIDHGEMAFGTAGGKCNCIDLTACPAT